MRRGKYDQQRAIVAERVGAILGDEVIRAALPAEAEFAWVIEKGSGSDLMYYAPTAPGEWVHDHLKACRFARKQDAEAIQFRHVQRVHLPVYDTRVCEHGWH